METFENCEIFSTYYFSYVGGCKAALRGGNNPRESFTENLKYMTSSDGLWHKISLDTLLFIYISEK